MTRSNRATGRSAASWRRAVPLIAFLASACATVPPAHPPIPELPGIHREFRGVWVASVNNIDWPTAPGLPVEQQKRELLTLLDSAVALDLNAIVLHIRPSADALYESELEPWSKHLTGEWGKAPEPRWDPLAFAIKEAHARGLQLHAWFNPFRAHDPAASTWAQDFVKLHPEVVKRYGRDWWLDPGEPLAQEHSVAVFRDVVHRYDVDGIHIDDYFYPYPVTDSAGVAVPFPDDPSWNRYVASGGTMSRDDWRRNNIDKFVEAMFRAAREEKPQVQVGISPFGIWRPGNPPSVKGFDAYEKIYADSKKWLQNGWVDYFTPQLYWRIDAPEQSYPDLLRWWVGENTQNRHIWPGLYTGRVGARGREARNDWDPEMIVRQIQITRATPGATGHIHFNWRALARNPKGISDSLRVEVYDHPAITPASPWLLDARPEAPEIHLRRKGDARWVAVRADGAEPRQWVLRVQRAGSWTMTVLPGHLRRLELPANDEPDVIAVAAVDKLGNEGWVKLLWPQLSR